MDGLTRDLDHTRPANILIARWDRGKPAALALCPAILGHPPSGAAALAAEARKPPWTLQTPEVI
jgi:2-keto-4-pentenoate hydratase